MRYVAGSGPSRQCGGRLSGLTSTDDSGALNVSLTSDLRVDKLRARRHSVAVGHGDALGAPCQTAVGSISEERIKLLAFYLDSDFTSHDKLYRMIMIWNKFETEPCFDFWHASNVLDVAIAIAIQSFCLSVCLSVTLVIMYRICFFQSRSEPETDL